MVLETLVAKKIITLPYKFSTPYELEVKPYWWRDDHYCGHHTCKGHKTEDCIVFKHIIQDLIDDRIIDVEIPKDLCNEDASLEQDHVDEPMSSDGFLAISIFAILTYLPKIQSYPTLFHKTKVLILFM